MTIMKHTKLIVTFAFLACQGALQADIVIPGANGTDGALNISQDTVIDLSLAPTGTWDQNNSAQAGKGVYDPEKWAVVFKYTSVQVATGKKVTFKNNASRAPVVWLVSGDVTIAGTLDLSGQSHSFDISWSQTSNPFGGALAEPGPGGFRGGAAWRGGDVLQGAGFGPGGGRRLPEDGRYGSAAGFGTNGAIVGPWAPRSMGPKYGNPSLIPLIGGSGGAGVANDGWGMAGPAGGGAILISASKKISIPAGSQILALGGNGYGGGGGGGGSGGGIRIICDRLEGSGSLNATGGSSPNFSSGVGRIRLERITTSGSLTITPAPSVIDLAAGNTAQLWPGADAPTAKIVSVNAVNAPADPKAAFGSYTPDVALPLVSQVEVILETVNVESASQVFIRVTPRNGATVAGTQMTDATEVAAVVSQTVSANPKILRWKATLPTLMGHSALQARVIRP
jgi:hypothetical protein